MSGAPSIDATRAALAELMGLPVDEVLHYAIVVRRPGFRLAHRFCGMPADGIELHGEAVRSLIAGAADMERAKLAAGCTPCNIRRTS